MKTQDLLNKRMMFSERTFYFHLNKMTKSNRTGFGCWDCFGGLACSGQVATKMVQLLLEKLRWITVTVLQLYCRDATKQSSVALLEYSGLTRAIAHRSEDVKAGKVSEVEGFLYGLL